VVSNEEIASLILENVARHTALGQVEILNEKTRASMFVTARTLLCGLWHTVLAMTPDQMAEKLPVGRSQIYRYLEQYDEILADDRPDIHTKRNQIFVGETIQKLSVS